MKVAVEGCCHGELDKIYETIQFIEQKDNIKVDLLLICGDFQAVRNRSDLQTMAVPQCYQKMNTFYKYYNGEKKAPVLTIVIGGNHEASSYMQELPYGGWLAPNIYYLGYAGVVQFGGLRIGGMSGIFKGPDYNRGRFEHPPYNDKTKRSVYHVRSLDVFRLKQLTRDIDIMLTHDWPRGIYNYGDTQGLLRRKKFFRDEVYSNTLGSPAAEELLFALKPAYWFSAHLHCKFAAAVEHTTTGNSETKTTRFLALDKCLPNRSFLQIIDMPQRPGSSLQLELDPEWLCVLHSTNHLLNLTRSLSYLPGVGSTERHDFRVSDKEMAELSEDFGGIFKVPDNFCVTAEKHTQLTKNEMRNQPVHPPQIHLNPHQTLLCEMLELTDPFCVFTGRTAHTPAFNQAMDSKVTGLDSDAALDDNNCDEGLPSDNDDTTTSFIDSTMETTNPDEISLDDIDDDHADDVKSAADSQMELSSGCSTQGGSSSGVEAEMNVSYLGCSPPSTSGCSDILSSSVDSNMAASGESVQSDTPAAIVVTVASRVDASSSLTGSDVDVATSPPSDRIGTNVTLNPVSSTPHSGRVALHLTNPIMEGDITDTSLCDAPVRNTMKRPSDEGLDLLAETAAGEPAPVTEAIPTKAKKFKRRNQSIYQNTDDD